MRFKPEISRDEHVRMARHALNVGKCSHCGGTNKKPGYTFVVKDLHTRERFQITAYVCFDCSATTFATINTAKVLERYK